MNAPEYQKQLCIVTCFVIKGSQWNCFQEESWKWRFNWKIKEKPGKPRTTNRGKTIYHSVFLWILKIKILPWRGGGSKGGGERGLYSSYVYIRHFFMPYRLRFQNLKNVLHRNATAEVSGYCDQRASTSERAGSILFFAYGKNRAFPLDCVFNPPRGLAIPYMGNITIFGVQNGTCCVLVLFWI